MMKINWITAPGVALLAIAMAVLFVASPPNADASEKCIADWAKASAIVQKQQMIDMDALSVLAKKKYNGQIMTARLCKGGSAYFYRLVIRRSNGRVERVKVDALDPTR